MPSISGIMMSISTMSMSGSACRMLDRVAAVVGRDDHHVVLLQHAWTARRCCACRRRRSAPSCRPAPCRPGAGPSSSCRWASGSLASGRCRKKRRQVEQPLRASGPGGRCRRRASRCQCRPPSAGVGSPSAVDDHRQPADAPSGSRHRRRASPSAQVAGTPGRATTQSTGCLAQGLGGRGRVGRRRSTSHVRRRPAGRRPASRRAGVRLDDQHAAGAGRSTYSRQRGRAARRASSRALDRLGDERQAPRRQRPLARLVGRDRRRPGCAASPGRSSAAPARASRRCRAGRCRA